MTDERTVLPFPDADAIEEVAANWVAKMDSGGLSLRDQAQLQRWLGENLRHREVFEEMLGVWGAADVLDAYNQIAPIEQTEPLYRERPATMLGGAIAACLVVFVAAVVFFVHSGDDYSGTYKTAVGERLEVALSDGSVALLNTDTVLNVAFKDGERRLMLVKGEAHFDVVEDPSRPFQVYAGDGMVRAVGTAFSVRLKAEAVEVIVSEGIVELLARNTPQAGLPAPEASLASAPYQSIAALTVNESAVFDGDLELKEKMNSSAVERKLMWRGGFIAFAGESLEEVVEEMSRYTDVVIEIDDPQLAATPIGAAFKAGDVEAMLDALQNVFEIDVRQEAPSRYVLVRRVL